MIYALGNRIHLKTAVGTSGHSLLSRDNMIEDSQYYLIGDGDLGMMKTFLFLISSMGLDLGRQEIPKRLDGALGLLRIASRNTPEVFFVVAKDSPVPLVFRYAITKDSNDRLIVDSFLVENILQSIGLRTEKACVEGATKALSLQGMNHELSLYHAIEVISGHYIHPTKEAEHQVLEFRQCSKDNKVKPFRMRLDKDGVFHPEEYHSE